MLYFIFFIRLYIQKKKERKKRCQFVFQDDVGQWASLDSELEMRGGEVVGTKSPTGHSLLIACRFEQPFGKSLLNKIFHDKKKIYYPVSLARVIYFKVVKPINLKFDTKSRLDLRGNRKIFQTLFEK